MAVKADFSAADPTRVSMEVAKPESLREWAARIITDRIGQSWKFGLPPFTRSEHAPEVSHSYYLLV